MPTLARCCLLALACTAGMAWGGEAKVYRCGQTYQQVPCPNETASQAVSADDPRSAEQRKDARAAAAADTRQAKALAAERLQREKAIQPQQTPLLIGLRPAEPAASAPPPDGEQGPTKKHKKKKKTPEPDRYMAPPPPADKR